MKSQISIIRKLNIQPSWSELLLSDSSGNRKKRLTVDKYVELAIHYVPKSMLLEAVSFDAKVENYEVPVELAAKYPPQYPREIIELEWNDVTEKWINQFITNLEQGQKITRQQRSNALNNIRKAIALYVIENYDDEDEDESR
ncbi:MAG: hypothetical protein RLZZ381_3376 [Cyanobacteriota bacterium]|jgi:hypothetical protein